MPQSVPYANYPANPLQISAAGIPASEFPVNLAPSSNFAAGTVLGLVSSTANDVQTSSLSGSASGGTFTLTGYNPITGQTFVTAALAYNCSSSDVQTELVKAANYGAGNVTVTGSSLAFVVTAAGALVAQPIPLLTLQSSLTGSTPVVTIAHTTIGRRAGTYAAYSSAVLAAPTVAPTLTAATGTSPGAGTWSVAYTVINAQGETTMSPVSAVTVTGSQKFTISSTAVPTGATGLNWYVSAGVGGPLVFYSTQATAAAQDVTAAATASAVAPPTSNTAYTVANGAGTQTAKCILKYPASTDAAGNISPTPTGGSGGEWGEYTSSTPAYFSGVFDTSQLTGLDATAVSQLGRLYAGTTSAGTLRVY